MKIDIIHQIAVLRNIIGFTMLISHILALLLCYFFLSTILQPADLKQITLILYPVTGVYVVAFIKYLAAHKSIIENDGEITTYAFAVATIGLTLVLCIFVNVQLIRFMSGSLQTIDILRDDIAYAEAAIGGLTGYLFDALFSSSNK